MGLRHHVHVLEHENISTEHQLKATMCTPWATLSSIMQSFMYVISCTMVKISV